MRQWSFNFKSRSEWAEFVKTNELADKEPLLVQVSCMTDDSGLNGLRESIREYLPNAVVVGASSITQLYGGELIKDSVVLSITYCTSKRAIFHSSKEKWTDSMATTTSWRAQLLR